MGQYWLPVNLDKKEFIHPHKLNSGLKLWEQLNNHGTGEALIVLCSAMPEPRGGGDLNAAPGVIGRWAGDRIALIGDYADESDLPAEFEAEKIYERCGEPGGYTDITEMLYDVLNHESCFFEANPLPRDSR